MYKPGDPWFCCPRCSFRVRYSQTRKEYTGIRVCEKCYDQKHPWLDRQFPPERRGCIEYRPEPEDVFAENLSVEEAQGEG